MPTKPGILARLFGRVSNSVVTKLYTHAIGQPLMLHPRIGERLIGAYMEGAVDAPQTLSSAAGTVAVIDVSGGLVNRPMPDICGEGPVSYASLRSCFDEALSDENVSAIIFRCDSPGGMAAGCFDLTDYIYANRGKKPILAQVDDMAYSACYAIASACDEIWLTRSAGVGSVGVLTYHVDMSGADSKAGIKLTYIYSGSHKVDGNWHEPLPASVEATEQAEVDRLRNLFATSVAKYRGMTPEAILATEAACFNGPEAVAAGMADGVGTLEDMLARLAAPAEEEAPPAPSDSPEDEVIPVPEPIDTPVLSAAGEPAAAAASTDPKAVAALAMKKALASSKLAPAAKVALMELEIPEADIPARVETASKIVDLCHAAKLDEHAADFITRNCSVEQVRKDLAAAVADAGPEIVTIQQPGAAKPAANPLDPTAIYAAHNNPRGKK